MHQLLLPDRLPQVDERTVTCRNLRKALEDLCSSKPEESLEAAAARHLLWAVKGADGAYGASRPEHTTTWRLHPKVQLLSRKNPPYLPLNVIHPSSLLRSV